jgi:hypothetical protein
MCFMLNVEVSCLDFYEIDWRRLMRAEGYTVMPC